MKSKAIALVLCMTFASGCYARLGQLTFASTKNLGTTYSPLSRAVSGEDCFQSVLYFPWGSLNPSVEEAVDRAVAQVPGGDMMTNASVYRDLLFTFVYNYDCIRVQGDVVNSASVQAPAPAVAASALTPSAIQPIVAPASSSESDSESPAPRKARKAHGKKRKATDSSTAGSE